MAKSGESIEQQRDAFVERMFSSVLGVMDIAALYLGDKLGYYRALSDADERQLTSIDLAARTGTHERYAREWLEQQVATGILAVDDPSADPAERRYAIPPGHVEPLLDADSLNYMAPFGRAVIGMLQPLPAVLEAFRTGGGVPYESYGEDLRLGVAAGNRPMFLNEMGRAWLPAVPEVHTRLQTAPPARVADIGCGQGWSSIAIAQSYPNVIVDGFDLDAATVAEARANIREAGLDGRVQIHQRDAGDPDLGGQYDLAIAVECIHDMSRPVETLRAMRRLTADGGVVIIGDERVAEAFSPEASAIEQYMYGASILHCLPVGMAEQPSAGTGTVMRPNTLRDYARAAGFRDIEVLPIENDFWRFYRMLA